VPRVAAVILHPGPVQDAGPLATAFAAIRRTNAERQANGFALAGATADIADDLPAG